MMTTRQITMLHEAIARQLIDGALTDGGASIWQGESADHGYLVGIPGHGLQVQRGHFAGRPSQAFIHAQVAAWVERTASIEHAATWGSWVDTDTDAVYFDVSSHHANLYEALTVGENRGELAIWDVTNGHEVRVIEAS